MGTANIHDRKSIEQVYSADAFAGDAAANDRHPAEVLRGVRISSAPDTAGLFAISPAAQQVGEVPGAVFLAPFRRETGFDDAPRADPSAGYDSFIDDIVNAAERLGYRADTSPGPGDPRLQGPRQ